MGPEAPFGTLTEHPFHSRKEGMRSEHPEQVDGTKLGQAFRTPLAPSGVLNGTAMTFGARTMVPL